ncbi:MAG: LptF/LptG family permease [Chlamydiales bacterium]|nr:LptF/LptG family permease [Chlamydiales bacterium]
MKLFMFDKIWERYFLREIVKVFSLFLFGFFFLYAAIDYSLHMQDFLRDQKLQISDLFIYYGFQFIKRAPLLLPLAILISTIKVLTSLNAHRELVALQSSGLSFKNLMRPFLFVGVLCTLFNIVSSEFLLPKSLTYLDRFYDKHIKHSKQDRKSNPIHVLTLKDSSKIVYQTYDKQKGLFFDVIWLKSSNEIWRMRYLTANPDQPEGRFIDHLVRSPQGAFEKRGSFESRVFKEISWDKDPPRKGFIPLENRSLSELYTMGFKQKTSSYMKMELLTHLCYKIAIPFLSLVVILAASPFCVRYARRASLFLLYALALFGYIAFFTLMDAAIIFGENRTLLPPIAIFAPFLLCSAPFIWNFSRK